MTVVISRDERLLKAGAVLPQIDVALKMGMDRAVLDKMLFNCLDVAPIGPNGSPDLRTAFAKYERMHGGFAGLFRNTQAEMTHEAVRLDLARAQALYVDLQELSALHLEASPAALARRDPEAREALANFGDLLQSVRSRVENSRALQQDRGLMRTIESLAETVYGVEVENRAAVANMHAPRLRAMKVA